MTDAQHFEAIKYSLRQSKDGVVVAFVVQPEDVRPELLALPVGSRVMIAWSAIGDDERPIGGGDGQAAHSGETVAKREPATIAAPEPKERKPFHKLELSAQCAIRCSDIQFWVFLRERYSANVDSESLADATVKGLMRITSKRELSTNRHAADRWYDLEGEFKAWLTDAHYAEYAR